MGQIDKSKLIKCANCACFNLRKATRAITQHYDDVLRPTGLRITQFTVLVHTYVFGPVTVKRLAKTVVMDRTTLTRNLKPLEKRGLINVEYGNDRRTRVVILTEKGQEALEKALPFWEKAQGRVVGELGSERWNSMLTDLSEMVSIARQT